MLEPIIPAQCVIACCFPTTKEEFLQVWAQRENGDFFKLKYVERDNAEQVWSVQYRSFAEKIEENIQFLESYGVRCLRFFTPQDANQIIGYKVFSLFAHFSEARRLLELADGLYTVEKYVNQLPKTFAGVFDISACNSVHLRDGIKNCFDNQVIAYDCPISILGFMAIYKQVIENLYRYEINYVDCYTRTIKDLKKNHT